MKKQQQYEIELAEYQAAIAAWKAAWKTETIETCEPGFRLVDASGNTGAWFPTEPAACRWLDSRWVGIVPSDRVDVVTRRIPPGWPEPQPPAEPQALDALDLADIAAEAIALPVSRALDSAFHWEMFVKLAAGKVETETRKVAIACSWPSEIIYVPANRLHETGATYYREWEEDLRCLSIDADGEVKVWEETQVNGRDIGINKDGRLPSYDGGDFGIGHCFMSDHLP